jgi:hypothetical protein
MPSICMLVPTIKPMLGVLYGSVGFLLVVAVVIHMVQHRGWAKVSFARTRS